MFKRLMLDDSTTVVTIVAFVTVVTIFTGMTWRALRMPRRDVERFEKLPFETEEPEHRHDPKA